MTQGIHRKISVRIDQSSALHDHLPVTAVTVLMQRKMILRFIVMYDVVVVILQIQYYFFVVTRMVFGRERK